VNESGTGIRFVHVGVHSNFCIHAVNEYDVIAESSFVDQTAVDRRWCFGTGQALEKK
jgi:hypothetical protein